MGRTARDATFVHPRRWYADHDIDLRTGVAVTGVDPAAHEVTLADGSRLGYSKLLLTTGSSPRRLGSPAPTRGGGCTCGGSVTATGSRQVFRRVTRGVVIGGGWIGLETAAAARAAGMEVTVLERAELPLLRVWRRGRAGLRRPAPPARSDLRFGVQVAEITGEDDHATGVRLTDGSHLPADAVIIGSGITQHRLADQAGLKSTTASGSMSTCALPTTIFTPQGCRERPGVGSGLRVGVGRWRRDWSPRSVTRPS